MAFNIAVSGLSAANKDLTVVGNNIANANTTGFKSARADFADIYQASAGGNGSLTNVGSGVVAARTNQSFSQGSVSLTGNNLDVSIQGSGFFVLDNAGKTEYTRAGLLALNSDGQLVNNQGSSVQGYSANDAGVLSTALGDLGITSDTLAPNQTSQITAALNLDAQQTAPAVTTFSSSNPASYNYTTSTTLFDSLGNTHTLNAYFAKTSTANEWKVYTQVDGRNVGDPTGASTAPTVASSTVKFKQDGTLDAANSTPVKISYWNPVDANGNANGALQGAPVASGGTFPTTGPFASSNFTVDLSQLTQLSSGFAIHKIEQNGFSTGQLNAINVSDDGSVSAHYSNGQDKLVGKIALANFSNVQGLQSIGDTHWAATESSGAAVLGTPSDAGLGSLQSGALEGSNVDLSSQLVSLIIAQRNFQANAKSIQTEDAISQAMINIH